MTHDTLRDAAMAALKALSVVTSTLMRPEKHMKVVRDLRLALTAPEQSPADAPAAPTSGEPVATLHDDGCFTWKRDEFRRLYDRQRAGWHMDVYATPPSAAQAEGATQQPIETIRYWLNAYSDPASGDHFMGHGMVVVMLREYLAMRLAALTAAPEKLEGTSVAFPFRIGSRKLLRRGHAQGLLRELGKWMQREAVGDVEAMELVSAYIDALEQEGQENDEFETRADGKRVRKDRWQWGIRRIVALLWGNRHEFEVDEVVEAVRKLLPTPFANGEDEALVDSVGRGFTPPSPQQAAGQPQRGAGEGLVPLESVLSKEEAEFVRAVVANPGSKEVGRTYGTVNREDGSEHPLWHRLEELGLLNCVGSYKWEPTEKIGVFIGIRQAHPAAPVPDDGDSLADELSSLYTSFHHYEQPRMREPDGIRPAGSEGEAS